MQTGLGVAKTLHILPGCKNAYETANYWKYYTIVEDAAKYSGTCGSCTWAIADNGELIVYPTEGTSGTLDKWTDKAPWCEYAEDIKSAVFTGTVIAQTCKGMFYGCSNLTSVNFGGAATTYAPVQSKARRMAASDGDNAEMGLDMTGVTDFSDMFTGCTSLVSIYTANTSPESINSNTFASLPTLGSCKLYVPEESVDAYKTAAGWEKLYDATGIEEISAPATISSDKIYSISGLQLNASAKGIYIKNGKKYLVK